MKNESETRPGGSGAAVDVFVCVCLCLFVFLWGSDRGGDSGLIEKWFMDFSTFFQASSFFVLVGV